MYLQINDLFPPNSISTATISEVITVSENMPRLSRTGATYNHFITDGVETAVLFYISLFLFTFFFSLFSGFTTPIAGLLFFLH